MALIANPIDTGRLSQDENGTTDQLEFIVDVSSRDPYRARADALRANGVPQYGQAHPVFPELRVTAIEVVARTSRTDQRIVRVTYSKPRAGAGDRTGRYGPMSWSAGTRTITDTARHDAAGRLMWVFYGGVPQLEIASIQTGESYIGGYGGGAFVRAARVHTAEVDRALLTLVGTRWERDDPMRKARDFRTVVNSDRVLGLFPPATLFAEGIAYRPDEAGGWMVDYAMSYNPDTWRSRGDIKLYGQTPLDATEGNGYQRFDVYPLVPFSQFELDAIR